MGRLGEIFRAHGEEYRARFASRMSHDQLKAMRDIEACHTPAAGRARWACPRCGKRHFTFVGCGNRHCPACGGTRARQWLQKHCALLLPGLVYHLVTFTVPRELRRVIRSHPRELLELLMRVSADTLLDLVANPKWVGGLPGITADGRYTIRYRTSDTNEPRTMRLEPHELIRRFLQHVLPSGFRKIRYYGLHHSSRRPVLRLLQAAMALRLGQPLPEPPVDDDPYVPECPECQTPMVFKERIAPRDHLSFTAAAGRNRGPPS